MRVAVVVRDIVNSLRRGWECPKSISPSKWVLITDVQFVMN
jgi:hypothetical protein